MSNHANNNGYYNNNDDYRYNNNGGGPPPQQSYRRYDTYDYNGGNGNPRKAIDDSTDCCAKICGLILLGFAITGVTMAWLSALSCTFIEFTIYDSNVTWPPGPETDTANEINGNGGRRYLVTDEMTMMMTSMPILQTVEVEEKVESTTTTTTFHHYSFSGRSSGRWMEEVETTADPTPEPTREPSTIAPTVVATSQEEEQNENGDEEEAGTQIPTLSPTTSNVTTPTERPTFFPRPTQSVEPSEVPSMAPSSSVIEGGLGIFQFQELETGMCYFYEIQSWNSLDLFFRLARLGAILMVIGSSIAGLFLLLEYCLCRVWCSRVLINTSLLTAIVGVPLTFLMFSDTRCYPVKTNQLPGVGCQIGTGGRDAVIAGFCLLVTFILACVAPKPIPFIRMAEDLERKGVYDNCCSCWPSWSLIGRRREARKRKNAANADVMEMDGLLADTTMAPEVVDTDGHIYKQYHDENAGYTLQNQYTAAYRRWLAFEADYEEGLGRFKLECSDANVNWRTFMRKAKAAKKREEQSRNLQRVTTNDDIPESFDNEDIPSSRSSPAYVPDQDGKSINFEDEDDSIYLDEELLRFVDVLTTMRANCDFAKDVMNRIQDDINSHTRIEDERQAMIDQKIRESKQAEERAKTKGQSPQNNGTDPSESRNTDEVFHSTALLPTSILSRSTTSQTSPPPPTDGTNAEVSRSTSERVPWTTIDQEGDLYASARMRSSKQDIEMVLTNDGTSSSPIGQDTNAPRDEPPENRISIVTSPLGTESSTPSNAAADKYMRPVARAMDRVQHARPNLNRVKMPKWTKFGGEKDESEGNGAEDSSSNTGRHHNRFPKLKNPFRHDKTQDGGHGDGGDNLSP